MERDVLELAGSLGFVDEIYEKFLADPGAVDPSWREMLGEDGEGGGNGAAKPTNGQGSKSNGGNGHAIAAPVPSLPAAPARRDRMSATTMAPLVAAPSVFPLVNAYRSRGHFHAHLDPLGLLEPSRVPELEPESWGFSDADLDRDLGPTGVHGLPRGTVRDVLAYLRRAYCGTIGLEFMHVPSPGRRSWLSQRMETRASHPPDPDTRKRMLELLINSEAFEHFCHVKYPGTKRFSLEGSEGLIPLLDLALTHGARLGAIETVIGMSHRGRLTALEQVLRRAARDIFAEFEDIDPESSLGGGDVKYHLGYSSDRVDRFGNAMHVSLSFNPSHLEAVDPVVIGRVRAKQTRHGDVEHRRVLGVLVHGDAAFAGQGLVPETLNLMNLPGYRTGGTLHVIVNNQVGFTASPQEQRSTAYCTDVAKMIECPIWHVNGEDLDAVAQVVEMAMEYRAQFASDVVIDMYCYRKYGHNEMDEPSFTQPLMYDRIQHKESVVVTYGKRLEDEGVVSAPERTAMADARNIALEAELEAAKGATQRPRAPALTGLWRGYRGGPAREVPDAETGVSRDLLEAISKSIATPPPGFTPHPKVVRLLEQRAQMGRGERPLDWGMGELLAYGSLLWQGTNVRLSGQDCARGTFSHRHALITDIKTGAEHLVLGHLHHDQGQCRIYDSPLSEAGVLGFEFGYSLDYPDALVMWEAQFGDFANGAQVIIDQFIVASEDKWNRLSGLVLLLPHGFEGQGPEHSSARLERFLQSAAEDCMQVCQPTTPAQMFHLLRRQVLRPWRKPMIVMTPKSLLRLPAAASSIDELTTGTFQRVIPDATADAAKVKRAVYCTGKIYYELVEERKQRNDDTTAIVRLEQLYPWYPERAAAAIAMYPHVQDVVFVQDEPANMGAATFITPRLRAALRERSLHVRCVSRDESASPATGSHKAHVLEHQRLMRQTFEGEKVESHG
ncbi:MAG TPA: 2-oxoglutarate dehydrogenase E1 component [Kofleriaceae bacterium]|nr:2-oxoglutarate dehydrogenase E1 component [Kofleriaceae bacterium]